MSYRYCSYLYGSRSTRTSSKKAGVEIKVETHGQIGVENELSALDIEQADAVIIAADKDVHAETFAQKKNY